MPYASANPYDGKTPVVLRGPVGIRQVIHEKLVRLGSFAGRAT